MDGAIDDLIGISGELNDLSQRKPCEVAISAGEAIAGHVEPNLVLSDIRKDGAVFHGTPFAAWQTPTDCAIQPATSVVAADDEIAQRDLIGLKIDLPEERL